MNYKYDKSKYSGPALEVINKAIKANVDQETFNIITRLNIHGKPLLGPVEMNIVFSAHLLGATSEKIEYLAETDECCELIHDTACMGYLKVMCASKLELDDIKLIMRSDDYGKILNYSQMREIVAGINHGLTRDEIMFCAKFNSDSKPIFDAAWMEVVRQGFEQGLSMKRAELLEDISKSHKFTSLQASWIKNFLVKANEKQYIQIKEAIEDGLEFAQITAFASAKTPAENMRVLRSFYELGCNREVVATVSYNNFTHEELKKIKYILKCAKFFKQKNKLGNALFKPQYMIPGEKFTVDDMYETLINAIYDAYSGCKYIDKTIDVYNVINKCIRNHLDAEKIHFILASKYNKDEMNNVADYLLDGNDFNKIKELRKESSELFLIDELHLLFTGEEKEKEL